MTRKFCSLPFSFPESANSVKIKGLISGVTSGGGGGGAGGTVPWHF